MEIGLNPISLLYSPWNSGLRNKHLTQLHPLTKATLTPCSKAAKHPEVTSTLSPLTLTYDPDFLPGSGNHLLCNQTTHKPLLAGECFHEGKFKDYETLKRDSGIPNLPIWTYFQLRNFLSNAGKRGNCTRQLTDLWLTRKVTSTAFTWLLHTNLQNEDRFRKHWSKELAMNITNKQWKNACILAHKCSISTKTQETTYKLLTDWYATAAKLHVWNVQTPDICWRCGNDTGTLVHIWWHCPPLATYWNQVRDQIKRITKTKMKLNAACCLLHISNFTIKQYKKSLTKHLLNAAKALKPVLWRTTRVPLVLDWLTRVAEICEMKDTLAQATDRVESLHKTWSPCLIFCYSDNYKELTANR